MSRLDKYESYRALIDAHLSSEVERSADAPSDAGREEVPLPASRPATNRKSKHGTESMYCMGCRCIPCTEANRLYGAVKRTRKRSRFDMSESYSALLDKQGTSSEIAAERTTDNGRGTYRCDHCGDSFATKRTRGAHVAEAHPFTKTKPRYDPPAEPVQVVIRHPRFYGGTAA